MKKKMLAALLLALLVIMLCPAALAAIKEPQEKTLEASNTYEYETLKIQIDQWCYTFSKKESLRFFVAHVYTQRPDQLKTAFAGDAYSRNAVEATSAIAQRNGAVLAVNGDYYNYKEDSGIVIRNGELYRDKKASKDVLLIDKDGNFRIVYRGDYTAGTGEQWLEEGAVQALTFGPALVDGGEIVQLPEKYAISTKDTQREPRTAIGQVGENHYVFVVADGRRNEWSEKGMTLQELQLVMHEAGCQVAYNLDGGGSTTMILTGERVNRGSTARERDVSDIIYFTN